MVRQTWVLGVGVLFLFLVAASAPASADTIFTNLGSPGSVYSSFIGWAVAGGGEWSPGMLFTPAITGNVTQIDLAVQYITNGQFNASIRTDVNGLPGSQVSGASWNNLTTSTAFDSCCGLVTISGISGVSLNVGNSYFMILIPTNITSSTNLVWNLNNIGSTGLMINSNNGGTSYYSGGTQTLGAFDILGTPVGAVPEPASLFLLGTGLGGLALAAWRRKKA